LGTSFANPPPVEEGQVRPRPEDNAHPPDADVAANANLPQWNEIDWTSRMRFYAKIFTGIAVVLFLAGVGLMMLSYVASLSQPLNFKPPVGLFRSSGAHGRRRMRYREYLLTAFRV